MMTHSTAVTLADRPGGRARSCSRGGARGGFRGRFIAVLAALVAGTAAPAVAQGWIDPLPGHPHPGVVRVRTDVDVRVTGRVAQVQVEEWFENRGPGLGEGVYTYPLPGEAVFSNFSLYQGDQELRGETMDADRARKIYREIVRRRRDPALIELVGHGMIRARVFPIPAGERRRITLRYTQVLERAGDALQFRYAGGSRPVPTGFVLTADADEYRDPFSPTHTLSTERRDGTLRVRPGSDLRGDLSVFLPLAGEGVGITVATHRPGGEDGYFMLTLSPGSGSTAATPRDITAVVDVSGSMSGLKLEQTKAALNQLLGSLAARDRFRLVAFSNRVRTSGEGWTRATPGEVRAARRWVESLRADGGTNIAGALQEALRLSSPDDRLPIVLFLTDGLPTVGERDPEQIADAADRERSRHRVFAFGVGYDVNTYLLDRLSAAGRGATEYVEPGEDVERVVSLLAGKITHPVLTDLELASAPVELVELYPGELPDLFAGEELVLFGRYRGDGAGRLTLRGRRAGETESFAARVEFGRRVDGNDFIPRLWASRKLGELTRQVRLHGSDPELVEAIRSTALRYGLLSEYTAYLVQEPNVVGNRPMLRARGVAAAPADAVGREAVKASARSRARLQVESAADLDAAEAEAMEMVEGQGLRTVGGRTFRQEDGAWVEVRPDDEARPLTAVALYSAAFFDLLEALPELRPVVEELEPVTVHGRDVSIRFDDDGATALSASEIRRLVERFRSR